MTQADVVSVPRKKLKRMLEILQETKAALKGEKA